MTVIVAAGAFAAVFLLLHYVTLAIAWHRCRPRQSAHVQHGALPPISLIRPLCGVESHTAETLDACFRLNYPRYEVLFCVADPADPVCAHAERAMRLHPQVPARLLTGNDVISVNPKLNNMVKGWKAAAYDRIAFVDSNVLLPPHFLQNLVATLREDTGVVSAPPVGLRADGFWSHLECAFLNTYEARWQYAAEAVGMGFAQGKTLFFRRRDLDAAGFETLASEPAEDAAATKMVRALGLRARLASPSPQPLGRRSAREVWSRQLRWARLRRVTFPLEFLPEIVTGCVLPTIAAMLAAHAVDVSAGAALAIYLAAWFAPEVALAALCRWPVGIATPFACLLRDSLIPVLWVGAWIGRDFTWRGVDIEANSAFAADM